MLHDAQFSCLILSWVCVSVFLLSLVEYGVFWGASSADILAPTGPVFVLSGDGCKGVASSGLNPGACDA